MDDDDDDDIVMRRNVGKCNEPTSVNIWYNNFVAWVSMMKCWVDVVATTFPCKSNTALATWSRMGDVSKFNNAMASRNLSTLNE